MDRPALEPAAHLTLPHRQPFDGGALLAFLSARSIDGIEQIESPRYRRALPEAGRWFELSLGARRCVLTVPASMSADPLLVARMRRLFDLDVDPTAVADVLSRTPRLRRLLARRPGLRVPGAWDGFELSVRAVLGQQISVAAARTLARRVVATHGTALPALPWCNEVRAFPRPERLADADLTRLGVTAARARTIAGLARAVADGRVHFDPAQTLDDFVAALTELPGIGDWTAQYIAMRALKHADAFPAGDLVLRRQAAPRGGMLSERELRARSDTWRPFRAYAVLHFWASSAD
jgi:AraC family transcriptional regulator of adaptative response / DNA-3-methyladenine glycosylase II